MTRHAAQERALLPDNAALVPGNAGRAKGGEKIDGHENASCPPGPPFFVHADQERIPQLRHRVVALGREAALPRRRESEASGRRSGRSFTPQHHWRRHLPDLINLAGGILNSVRKVAALIH